MNQADGLPPGAGATATDAVNGQGPTGPSQHAGANENEAEADAELGDSSEQAAPGEQGQRKRRRRRRKRRAEGQPPGALGTEGSEAPDVEGGGTATDADAGQPEAPKQPAVRALSPKEIDLAARAVQFLGKHNETLRGALTPELQELLTQPAADRTIYQRLQDILAQALSGPDLRGLPLTQRIDLTTEALEACPTLAVFCSFADARLQAAAAERDAKPAPDGNPPPTEPSAATDEASAQASDEAAGGSAEGPAPEPSPEAAVSAADSASATGAADNVAAGDAPSEPAARRSRADGQRPPRPNKAAAKDVLALLEPLRRSEFAKISKEVLNQFVERSDTWVAPSERLEWLSAALENKELKRALDGAERALPEAWQRLLPQARALLFVVLRGQTHPGGARALKEAVRGLLRSGARSLLGRSAAIRERFARVALELRVPDSEARVLSQVLETLRNEEAGIELELMSVRALLSSGRHDRAETELIRLADAHGHRSPAGHWLKAMSGPRFGQLALFKSRVNPPVEHKNALRPGFCFADQTDVWVRVGDPEEAAQFLTQLDIHRRALVPCVAMIHESGFTNSRRPFIAYSRKGENARQVLESPRGLERREALIFARQLLQLGYGLGRAGVLLPDADFGRLELTAGGQLWLVESWGSRLDPAALLGMVEITRQWQLKLLSHSSRFELPRESRENFEHAADFETIRATLDALWRNYYWAD